MKRHRTHNLGPLPCGSVQNRRQVDCQRTRQVAVPAVLEAQEGLGQRPPVGERSERPREGERRSTASMTATTSLARHGASRAAGSKLDKAHRARGAEAVTFGHEGIAPSATGRPQNGKDVLENHPEILGSDKRKVACLASGVRSPTPLGGALAAGLLCPPV